MSTRVVARPDSREPPVSGRSPVIDEGQWGPPPTWSDPILYLILSPFLVALIALWLVRRWPWTARLLALWPALLTLALALELRQVLAEGPRLLEWPWAPSLRLSLSF